MKNEPQKNKNQRLLISMHHLIILSTYQQINKLGSTIIFFDYKYTTVS